MTLLARVALALVLLAGCSRSPPHSLGAFAKLRMWIEADVRCTLKATAKGELSCPLVLDAAGTAHDSPRCPCTGTETVQLDGDQVDRIAISIAHCDHATAVDGVALTLLGILSPDRAALDTMLDHLGSAADPGRPPMTIDATRVFGERTAAITWTRDFYGSDADPQTESWTVQLIPTPPDATDRASVAYDRHPQPPPPTCH